MARRIRIPGLIDIVRVDDPRSISSLAAEKRLDRDFTPSGPLFNRLLSARLMRILSVGGRPLPTMRARDDSERLADRARLSSLPDFETPTPAQTASLAPLVAYVRGQGPAGSIGAEVQALVGRQFNAGYTASPTLWRAAVALDAAARSTNPLMWLWLAITGSTRSSRALLAEAVAGDTVGVHATGIAVHNIAASLDRMRAAYAIPRTRHALDATAAATAMLSAPQTVLRQAKSRAHLTVGELGTGTLVTLELARATERTLDTAVAFQSGTWSGCPADRYVFNMLRHVWQRAIEEEKSHGGSSSR